MSRAGRRVELTPVYVLHHRPWRDTSRILDVWSREHGRLSLFARGVRGGKPGAGSLLRPFQPLLASWSGRGDAAQLTRTEAAADETGAAIGALPAAALMSAWYLNEIVLNLTTRLDPQPSLYDEYHATLGALRASAAPAPALRRFERRLLEHLGYGLDCSTDARSGEPLQPDAYYHFHVALGFVRASGEPGPGAFAGASVLALGRDEFTAPQVLDAARRVLRLAIDHLLEGRELRTRAVARSLARSAPAGASVPGRN
jgi:DNA repair protein RecO (recombination protein O)